MTDIKSLLDAATPLPWVTNTYTNKTSTIIETDILPTALFATDKQGIADAELSVTMVNAAPLVLEYMKAADLLIDSATRDDIFVPPKQIGEQYERYIRAKDALARALGVGE